MFPITSAHLAAHYIRERCPDFNPHIGIILGSGLGSFTQCIDNHVTIPYTDLPGFPKLTVNGHGGNLVLGNISGCDVVCLQGRAHTYEGSSADHIKTYIRTLKLLGCKYLLITNASGSLRQEMPPGDMMLITDHINFQPINPLVGPNDDEFGPRFYPLDNAYDADMRNQFLSLAKDNNIKLHQGVYISVLGPNYETAAEIKAFSAWGADAVGMSTVPEVLVANHCGLRVAAIATLSNYATGLAQNSHNHDAVVATAQQTAEKLTTLISSWIRSFGLL